MRFSEVRHGAVRCGSSGGQLVALSAYTSTVVKSAGGFSGRLILILRFQRYTDFGFDFHESGLGGGLDRSRRG